MACLASVGVYMPLSAPKPPIKISSLELQQRKELKATFSTPANTAIAFANEQSMQAIYEAQCRDSMVKACGSSTHRYCTTEKRLPDTAIDTVGASMVCSSHCEKHHVAWFRCFESLEKQMIVEKWSPKTSQNCLAACKTLAIFLHLFIGALAIIFYGERLRVSDPLRCLVKNKHA